MLINDILINITHKQYMMFYDWGMRDQLISLKQVPLIYLNKMTLYQIINFETSVSNQLVNKIINRTIIGSTKPYISNKICIISDGIRALAIIIDHNNKVIRRSALLYDEEQEVVSYTIIMHKEDYNFRFGRKINYYILLTHQENKLFRKIKKELTKTNNYDKLNYWHYLLTANTEEDLFKIKQQLNNEQNLLALIKLLNY